MTEITLAVQKQDRKKRRILKGQLLEINQPIPLAVFLSLVKDGYRVRVNA